MLETTRKYILAIGLAILIVLVLYHVPAFCADFSSLYRAGQAVWKMQNPYTVAPGFFNPPWMLILLAPIALLDLQSARWMWFALGLVCYSIAFKRLRLSNWNILLMFLSPFVYYDLGIGNYEWLILLGATLPPTFGSWIVILKPQSSIVLFGQWMKQRRWTVIIPIATLAMLLTLQVYPLPDRSRMFWSADIWPYGIPIGIVLTWLSITRDDMLLALAAAPFLSPYVGMQTWVMTLLPLTRNKVALIAGILIGWICMFLFIL